MTACCSTCCSSSPPPTRCAAWRPSSASSACCSPAPLVYGGWESATAAKALAEFVIWTPLAFLVFLMMSSIRAQRLSMRREEEQAREEARLDELTGDRQPARLRGGPRRRDLTRRPHGHSAGAWRWVTSSTSSASTTSSATSKATTACTRVAQAMDSELRTPDRVFRWGGDEFALLLPGTSEEGAEVADRADSGQGLGRLPAPEQRADLDPLRRRRAEAADEREGALRGRRPGADGRAGADAPRARV